MNIKNISSKLKPGGPFSDIGTTPQGTRHSKTRDHKVVSTLVENCLSGKNPGSKQLPKESLMNRSLIQHQLFQNPPINTFTELFSIARKEGFDKKTIATGYTLEYNRQSGYCFQPISSQEELTGQLEALSSRYNDDPNFNITYAWKNACSFEIYAIEHASLFVNSHEHVLKRLGSAKRNDDFQPLHWIQEINTILQKDKTHKVGRLASLWIDFSILIAIQYPGDSMDGDNNRNGQELTAHFRGNTDKFNWQRVPPLMINQHIQPEVISIPPVNGSSARRYKNNTPSHQIEFTHDLPIKKRKRQYRKNQSNKIRSAAISTNTRNPDTDKEPNLKKTCTTKQSAMTGQSSDAIPERSDQSTKHMGNT